MGILNFTRKLHDECVKNIKEVKFNKSLKKDGYVVCLYASLIEYAGAYLTLVEVGRRTGSSSIFRSFLEAYVDLINLDKDPSYIDNCFASYHNHWVNVLKASDEANPYLSKISSHEGKAEALKRHLSELERLNKLGKRRLSAEARFERAGMNHEYQSIYRFESVEAHNQLGALMKRHFEELEDGYGLKMYDNVGEGEFKTHLDSIAGLMLAATRTVHTRLKYEQSDWLNALTNELGEIRSSYETN